MKDYIDVYFNNHLPNLIIAIFAITMITFSIQGVAILTIYSALTAYGLFIIIVGKDGSIFIQNNSPEKLAQVTEFFETSNPFMLTESELVDKIGREATELFTAQLYNPVLVWSKRVLLGAIAAIFLAGVLSGNIFVAIVAGAFGYRPFKNLKENHAKLIEAREANETS